MVEQGDARRGGGAMLGRMCSAQSGGGVTPGRRHECGGLPLPLGERVGVWGQVTLDRS
jgi:hypothetical protein